MITFALRHTAIFLGLTALILLGVVAWMVLFLGVFALFDWMGWSL